MTAIYRHLIRPILFRQDSEAIHNRTLGWLGRAGKSAALCNVLRLCFAAPPLPVNVLGLTFPNPIGLAAGMDKNAVALPVWEALGFGFVELGGVTWHAQPGNPPPRMFRAVADEALVNRMGFNNEGAEAFARRLADWRGAGRWPAHPVGVNLGKSKITPLERAAEDYTATFRLVWPHADFFVVNVSSPNTPNLRQLQDKAALAEILRELHKAQQRLLDTYNANVTTGTSGRAKSKPILVKVAPDLSFEALDEILELTGPLGAAGLVATNTTLARPATRDAACERAYAETGGLSGRPLRARSTEVIRHIAKQTQGRLPIIGVGGIFTAADAREKLDAGASLVQVYSGLVFEGPGLARTLVEGLRGTADEARQDQP